MSLERLLSYYEQDERVRQLTEELATPPARIHLKGLVGSVDSFIAASTFRQDKHHHLFILPDREDAAYFQNNLRNLIENKDIFLFPDSYKRPGKFDELDNNNVLMRTEVVNRITNSNSKSELIVTYPEALFEHVVDSKVLRKNTLHIKVGESLDVEFINEVLVEYGFEHTDFVYEPGQVSVRGGIIDIFSFANDMPYRIELFDDEVESIRLFDPVSQLSERKIASITIVPNIQTHFGEEEKTSLFRILNKKSVVWCKDMQLTIERLEDCMEKATAQKQALGDTPPAGHERNPLYLGEIEHVFESAKKVLFDISDFSIIEFGDQTYNQPDKELFFNTTPQPSFNKNFELLINDLKGHESSGYANFIFAENPKQIERFYSIFADLKAEVNWQPVNKSIHGGFIDEDLKLVVYTDHQVFNRYHKYNVKRGYSKDQALLMKQLRELKPGDFVTHIDHGVGMYSGLEKIEVNGQVQESVRIKYADGDLLYVNINSLHKISKYTGKEGTQPKVNKLGSEAWANLKRRTKKKIKDIAEDLIRLYAKRKAANGFAFSKDNYLQNELEASFIYEDTPDQLKATNDVKEDMEQTMPMDRLICGDVGFGKTEVAIRAAFKAVNDGKQVAVLVPTTILAMQHHKTFAERLEDMPVTVDYINRFKTGKEKSETLKKLADGKVDILVGTHAIVGKKVKFKDLGLLIIDEEQKFGVGVKEKLKELKVNVDTLTLTATPIPRTLQFSLMGARDLSVINTPPPNRQPVTTEVLEFNADLIKEAIAYEVYRGGQVFFVHNRVRDIMDIKIMLKGLLPDIDIGVAHGQMEGHELEKVMMAFIKREYDVLLSTNIIESGLDIPNANTIIINNANNFGLSDLHQLRGRVGRSNKKAFCYLFRPPLSTLTREARERLRTIEEFAEIGSGFNIAMRDLDIRGAGNLLGGEQSGFIADIGYEMYHKILDEAIQELKETEFKDLYKEELDKKKIYIQDTQIDTDLEMLIPDHYVRSVNERMSLYTELNNIKDEEGLLAFQEELIDRFGTIPPQVKELFSALRLKWLALRLGLERIIFKDKKMRCFFPENQENPFYQSMIFGQILKYVTENPSGARMKQTDKYLILIFENVYSMSSARDQLQKIDDYVYQEALTT